MELEVRFAHTIRGEEMVDQRNDHIGPLADRTCLVDQVVYLAAHSLGMDTEQLYFPCRFEENRSGLKWVSRVVELLRKIETVVEGCRRVVRSAELGDVENLSFCLRLCTHALVGRPLGGRLAQVFLLLQQCRRLHFLGDVERHAGCGCCFAGRPSTGQTWVSQRRRMERAVCTGSGMKTGGQHAGPVGMLSCTAATTLL